MAKVISGKDRQTARAKRLDEAEKKALGIKKKAKPKPKAKAKKKSVRKSVSDDFWGTYE